MERWKECRISEKIERKIVKGGEFGRRVRAGSQITEPFVEKVSKRRLPSLRSTEVSNVLQFLRVCRLQL